MSPAPDPTRGRATVLGLGLFGGGAAAARWLARRGAAVTVTDLRGADELGRSLEALAGVDVRYVLGGHDPADFEAANLVVANPAVPAGHALLERARAAGARVTSDVALFLEHARCPWVGVTGTQGKSSTVTFAATLLERAGAVAGRAVAAGNVGVGLLDLCDELGPDDALVCELSSYQLEHLAREAGGAAPPAWATARAVAVTNVLRDHLARHGSLAAYREAKRAIVALAAPDAPVLLPAADRELAAWDLGGRRRVAFSADGADGRLTLADGVFRLDGEPLGRAADLAVPGTFQRANALVALGLARALGAPPDRLAAAVGALRAPPHRLEDLGSVAGVRVFDNAIATTPDATEAALASLEGPLVLVCGGQDKALDWAPVGARLAASGSSAVAFGRDAETVAAALHGAGVEVRVEPRLDDAVARGLERAAAAGTLLFSPGAASFDAFPNVLERARAFRAALARSAAPAQ